MKHIRLIRKVTFSFTLIIIIGCKAVPYDNTDQFQNLNTEEQNTIKSLSNSVEMLVNAGGNLKRAKAILNKIEEFNLSKSVKLERIDWLSRQKNIIIDLKGKKDSIVYILAHYDKTDINPFKVLSVLLNGALDELISWSFTTQGALDNGTGVAVGLELSKFLSKRNNLNSYRIVLLGSEESGLRGSRAHVARLSNEEFNRIKYVINIDVVGVKGKQNCVVNISDPSLAKEVIQISENLKIPIGVRKKSALSSGDYRPFLHSGFFNDFLISLKFNLLGSLLPQRSYFSKSKKTMNVISFTSCDFLDVGDYSSMLIPIPLGQIHSFRDNINQIDFKKLSDQFNVIKKFIINSEETIP